MKNRFLPLSFFVLVFGFISLHFVFQGFAGNPGNTEPSRDHFQQMRINQVTGTIQTSDILRAQAQVRQMSSEKAASDLGLNWKQLGPNNAAGRVRAVLFDNKDASGQTIYIGGVTGGIWRTTNSGLTWHMMDSLSNQVLRVTSLVQSSSGTIYAATGESYCDTNIYPGTGIYKSDDGVNFTVISSTQPNPNDPNADWAYITKLAMGPSGRIFAATNTGLKYSDNGTDWAVAKSGYADNVVVGSDGTVIASFGGTSDEAYVAVGGDFSTFINVSTNTDTTLSTLNVGGIELAFAPSDANIVYASLCNSTNGALLNVYRSDNKGLTWTVVFPGNSTYNPLGTRGCYANCLAVYPNDPYQIMLGGNTIWHGKKYQAAGYYYWEQVSFGNMVEDFYDLLDQFVPYNSHQIVFRPNTSAKFAIATDDGISMGSITSSGFSFQHLINNCIISQFHSVAFSTIRDAGMGGADFIGTMLMPGGTTLNNPENGYQINPGYGGDVAWSFIHPASIFWGTESTTTPLTRSEDLGATTSPTFLRSIQHPGFTPVALWENVNFDQSPDSATIVIITDKFWPRDTTVFLPSANAKFGIPYTMPDSISKGDTVTVRIKDVVQARFFMPGFLGDSAGIYMTRDALKFSINPKWYRIGSIPKKYNVSCIAVSNDLNVLWAGTKTGNLYRFSNLIPAVDSATADVDTSTCVVLHAAYDSTIYPAFKNRYITSIAISPDDNSLVVTLGNYGNSEYVYKSSNAMDPVPTFQSVQSNLPAMPVYAGVFEMNDPNKVVIGTDFGVYTTNDISTATPVWADESTGTGNVPITAIKQQTNSGIWYYRPENYRDLYLSSYGRGLFWDKTFETILGTDPILPKPTAENTLKVQPNPFTEKVAISYKIGKATSVTAKVYDLMGRLIYSVNYGTQQSGSYLQTLNLGSIQSGTYIIVLDYGSGRSFGKAIKL